MESFEVRMQISDNNQTFVSYLLYNQMVWLNECHQFQVEKLHRGISPLLAKCVTMAESLHTNQRLVENRIISLQSEKLWNTWDSLQNNVASDKMKN